MNDRDYNAFGRFIAAHPKLWPVIRWVVMPVVGCVMAAARIVKEHIPEFIAEYRVQIAEMDGHMKAIAAK